MKTQIYDLISAPRPIEVIQPCNPSPCGINADCQERNNAASCKCIADYIGNPYIECKPECVVNAECPRDKACVNQKCKDPCPGVCGAYAYCTATNHNAICQCEPGYTGNAFVACQRITTRKFDFLNQCTCFIVLFRTTKSANTKTRSLQSFSLWVKCTLY